MSTSPTASVRVQVTLDIDLPDTWGMSATAGQIRSQAISGAEGRVRRMIGDDQRTRIVKIASVHMIALLEDKP